MAHSYGKTEEASRRIAERIAKEERTVVLCGSDDVAAALKRRDPDVFGHKLVTIHTPNDKGGHDLRGLEYGVVYPVIE